MYYEKFLSIMIYAYIIIGERKINKIKGNCVE